MSDNEYLFGQMRILFEQLYRESLICLLKIKKKIRDSVSNREKQLGFYDQ